MVDDELGERPVLDGLAERLKEPVLRQRRYPGAYRGCVRALRTVPRGEMSAGDTEQRRDLVRLQRRPGDVIDKPRRWESLVPLLKDVVDGVEDSVEVADAPVDPVLLQLRVRRGVVPVGAAR